METNLFTEHHEHLLANLKLPKKFLSSRAIDLAVNNSKALKSSIIGTNQMITRFPPEPNGYLHLGHAKAINLNFSLAGIPSSTAEPSIKFNFFEEKSLQSKEISSNEEKLSEEPTLEDALVPSAGGMCILRLDDSNPSTCEITFVESIKSSLEWLGYTPSRVTSASENFSALFGFALSLIVRGEAFVCFLNRESFKAYREKKEPSPTRDSEPSENLSLFMKMATGGYKEGEATLRLKLDYKHPSPHMRDPAIYRISHTPHPCVNSATYPFVAFPLYDFTHCICDSLERVSISCCTLEFENRRDLYYAILDKLGLYKPWVFESARLSVEGVQTSKRKIAEMVSSGEVEGWDDPRLFTLVGLKARGVPPVAINRFVRELGVTRNDSTLIPMEKFNFVLRDELDAISHRSFCVKRKGARVLVINGQGGAGERLPMDCWASVFPNLPEDEAKGAMKRKVVLGRVVLLNQEDFMENGNKKYFGLTDKKDKTVRLKYCLNIQFRNRHYLKRNEASEKDLHLSEAIERSKIFDKLGVEEGVEIIEVEGKHDESRVKKGSLTFVTGNETDNRVQLKIYDYDNGTMTEEEAFVSDYVFEAVLRKVKWFQFERMGFFYLNDKSVVVEKGGSICREKSKIIFNNVVDMKISKVRASLLNNK